MALELAKRPQNLTAVKKLCDANAFFIDTTYAAGLQECFDPAHPLTRADDMKWKQAISDYGRQVFGVFGSECGREWAIPHSDFFEGLTGVSGDYFHDAKLITKLGATAVPLFELVYRDTIAMYGKYEYDPRKAGTYVLNHISMGRPLNYHDVPQHLYWKSTTKESEPLPLRPFVADSGKDPALFTRADNGWAEGMHVLDRFVKNTYEVLSPLNELTARVPMTGHTFLTRDRKVQRTTFGEGRTAVTVIVNAGDTDYACDSRAGGKLRLPPNGFLIDSPSFAAFYARDWNGMAYEEPTLFTLRSLDARPLGKSRKVRIYHGFGDDQIRVGKTLLRVQREEVRNP